MHWNAAHRNPAHWLSRPFAVSLIAILLTYCWMALTIHYSYAGNWTALFCTGEHFPAPALVSVEHPYVFANSDGYDGQFYHDLAHDPLLNHETAPYVDAPRLRQRRILIPALAWLLAAGRQPLIDRSYFVLMLAFLGMGVCWMARYIVDHLNRSPWWGLVYLAVPSTIISIDRMTIDIALTTLFMGFVYYAQACSSIWVLWAIAAAACLTRETGLCIVGGYALYLLWQRRFRTAAVFTTSAMPFFAWALFVNRHTAPGTEPVAAGHLFNAFIDAIVHPLPYNEAPRFRVFVDCFDMVALAALVVTFVLACRMSGSNRVLPWVTIPFVALAIALTNLPGEYASISGYGRVLSPIVLGVTLDAFRRRSVLGFSVFGILSARTLVLIASQIYNVMRGLMGLAL